MGIKNSLPKQVSFCEHIWEVVICIVMTGERFSGPYIWPESSNQSTDIEEMIFTIWYKKAMKQSRINL